MRDLRRQEQVDRIRDPLIGPEDGRMNRPNLILAVGVELIGVTAMRKLGGKLPELLSPSSQVGLGGKAAHQRLELAMGLPTASDRVAAAANGLEDFQVASIVRIRRRQPAHPGPHLRLGRPRGENGTQWGGERHPTANAARARHVVRLSGSGHHDKLVPHEAEGEPSEAELRRHRFHLIAREVHQTQLIERGRLRPRPRTAGGTGHIRRGRTRAAAPGSAYRDPAPVR